MLNLFSLGRTALGIVPSSVKEGIADAISNNKNIQKLQKNEIFQASKNWLDTTSQKANNFIKETAKTARYGKLFSDEKEAYQKMKNDGIDDNEAFDLIKKRRQAMSEFYGSDSKLTKTESDALQKMRADGIGSEDAFKGLMEYRSGFDNRTSQIAHENKQAKQKAWDKQYEEMPWYKKAGYHAWMTGVGIGEGALKTGINTADFLLGGTETGQQMREGTEMWNNNPMMNGTARGVGNFLGEAAVMGGTATVGGAALGATKTGAALGINSMMTPASTWGGMVLQGAAAGAGYGAWSEIANKGADATAEGIGKQAAIGGTLGGVATPIIGKVIAPAVGSAIKGTAKVGNAGIQAFNHTAGTLDDRVASALAAIRKSTGRSVAHTGQNIANTAINAKDALFRKFLSNTSDDVVNIADDVAGRIAKTSKLQSIKNNIAGLDERDLQILRKTTTEEYDDWIKYAKDAVDNNYAQTPYHKGAKKANEAMNALEEKLQANQLARMEKIQNSGIDKISLNEVRPEIIKDLKKTFNIEGWKYGKDGEIIPKIVQGRKNLLDMTNSRDLQALSMIDDALKGGNPAEVMDTVKILQNHLYDSSTGLRVSNDMKKFLERTTGKINHQFKTTMGEEYTKILAEMSDDIKLQKELDRIFKPSDLDGVTNRGELAMKRISNGTTTSGEVRDLALKIQERTGIDLIKEARLAQMSMDIVGDTRWANLFGIIKDGKNGVIKSALDMGRNLVANKEVVARANTIKNILWVPKDTKIAGLNQAISEIKFSKNDIKMIVDIAKNLKNKTPLTKMQSKNLITIQKLVEEKIPQKEVENFRKTLPNYNLGKGLESKAEIEPVVAMSNASKRFDEGFRKISEKQFEKLKNAVDKNEKYGVKIQPTKRVVDLLKNNGYEWTIKQHIITSDGIRHIFKRHWVGNETNPDQIPVTWDDIKYIPEIQLNPDNITISPKRNNRNQEVIIYEKKIGGVYFYLENIDSYWNLQTQTMYKK